MVIIKADLIRHSQAKIFKKDTDGEKILVYYAIFRYKAKEKVDMWIYVCTSVYVYNFYI